MIDVFLVLDGFDRLKKFVLRLREFNGWLNQDFVDMDLNEGKI